MFILNTFMFIKCSAGLVAAAYLASNVFQVWLPKVCAEDIEAVCGYERDSLDSVEGFDARVIQCLQVLAAGAGFQSLDLCQWAVAA